MCSFMLFLGGRGNCVTPIRTAASASGVRGLALTCRGGKLRLVTLLTGRAPAHESRALWIDNLPESMEFSRSNAHSSRGSQVNKSLND
jgi:hypothetical protein